MGKGASQEFPAEDYGGKDGVGRQRWPAGSRQIGRWTSRWINRQTPKRTENAIRDEQITAGRQRK